MNDRESLFDAAARVLRKAGFFPWGHDSWCHDLDGIGVVTTAEALDLLYQDDRIADAFPRKVLS